MDEKLSEIIVIMDRSGSMGSMRVEAITGFNEFLEKQKKSQDGQCLLTYCQFNTNYEIIHNGVPVRDVPPLNEDTFVPAGMTALWDAVGRTIDEVGARLAATPKEDRPGDVTVVIITDGQENSSQEYALHQVKERIAHQTEKYNWSFMFLGQNIDSKACGRAMGMDVNSGRHYMGQMARGATGQSVGYQVMGDALIEKRKRFAGGQSVSFSVQDKMGYDTALAEDTGDSDS